MRGLRKVYMEGWTLGVFGMGVKEDWYEVICCWSCEGMYLLWWADAVFRQFQWSFYMFGISLSDFEVVSRDTPWLAAGHVHLWHWPMSSLTVGILFTWLGIEDCGCGHVFDQKLSLRLRILIHLLSDQGEAAEMLLRISDFVDMVLTSRRERRHVSSCG